MADEGAGIAKIIRDRIFEPLFTTKLDTGSGLGLWVAKEIVESYGGAIRVRSRSVGAKRGTVVSVLLPEARLYAEFCRSTKTPIKNAIEVDGGR